MPFAKVPDYAKMLSRSPHVEIEEVMASPTFPLAETLRSLRAQLLQAVYEAKDEQVVFELGPVEVELVGVVEREGGASGNAEFKVLGIGGTLGGSGKLSAERTHRIKLTLTPKIRNPLTGERGPVDAYIAP